MSGLRYLAVLMLAVTALSGCSLVDEVLVIENREHRKEAARPAQAPSSQLPSKSASTAPSLKCSSGGANGPGCHGEGVQKASKAKYDSGPVLKPIKKTSEKKSSEAREDSAFVSAVKSWLKAGLQLPGWAGPQ